MALVTLVIQDTADGGVNAQALMPGLPVLIFQEAIIALGPRLVVRQYGAAGAKSPQMGLIAVVRFGPGKFSPWNRLPLDAGLTPAGTWNLIETNLLRSRFLKTV